MFNEFLKLLSSTYYTVLMMVFFQLIAAIISFIHRKKFQELKYFHIYPLAGLGQSIFFIISVCSFDKVIGHKIIEASVNIFTLIEVGLFYHLSFQSITIKYFKQIIRFSLLTFGIYCSILWIFTNAFTHNSSRLFPIEGIIILIPICFYFINLFKLPPTLNLFNQPSFWINIGMLFAFCCIFPLNLLEYFLQKFVNTNFYFYYINFVSYAVLYFFVTRAYLCKIEVKERMEPNINNRTLRAFQLE
jgi:hypothetical protein